MELTAGIGPATAGDLVLDLGAHHPSTHGSLRLALALDGDRIVAAEPVVGYLHRGHEKLYEVRDYRQCIVLANRHDWLSSFSNELGIVLAVERMMGLAVPARAVWLRTLLAELNRVLSALMFLGSSPAGPIVPAHQAREALQRVMEEAAGGRMHYMFNRVGGLKEDVPAGWTGRVRDAVGQVRDVVDPLRRVMTSGDGIGVLTPGVVEQYGVTGAPARASGVDVDLRRDDPYLAYAELGFGTGDFAVVLDAAGDVAARFRCLLGQIPVSLDLAEACLRRLPSGPIDVRLPKTVRAPEGATYTWTENPLGAMGWYLVSRGQTTPWRLAMRTASFNNVSALAALLPGQRLADLVPILASMFFVVGDVDK